MSDLKEKLRAWTLADELVLEVHALTKKLPTEEHHEMPAMLRKAVLSAALRIVQGVQGQGTEFEAALRSALGSLSEFRYYLYLSKRLGIIDLRRYRAVCLRHDRVHKFLREVLARPRGAGSVAAQESVLPPGELEAAGAEALPFSRGQEI